MLSSSLRRLVVKVRPLLFPDQSDSVDTGSDLLMWTLVENYTHMDLAVIGELNLDSCLAALQLEAPGSFPTVNYSIARLTIINY